MLYDGDVQCGMVQVVKEVQCGPVWYGIGQGFGQGLLTGGQGCWQILPLADLASDALLCDVLQFGNTDVNTATV